MVRHGGRGRRERGFERRSDAEGGHGCSILASSSKRGLTSCFCYGFVDEDLQTYLLVSPATIRCAYLLMRQLFAFFASTTFAHPVALARQMPDQHKFRDHHGCNACCCVCTSSKQTRFTVSLCAEISGDSS